MRLPKYFVIYGQKVKVEYAELENTVGGLSYSSGLIQINKHLPKEHVPQVLLHEFFHSVISRTSLDQRLSLDVEEMIVELLSKAVVENFDVRIRKV